jgi:ABC-type transporter Mla maintaining outer membrane lipid asymmetry ATPase subunit MlaF
MIPKIELAGVRKVFGSKVVLDGVDLAVQPGESMVIIGGSGTGKSVTINGTVYSEPLKKAYFVKITSIDQITSGE